MEWTGHSRSEAEFRLTMEAASVDVTCGVMEHAGKFAVSVADEWPDLILGEDGELVEFDFIPGLAEFLADGEVCILMTVGHEGARYVSGRAVAFDRNADPVEVTLDEIYARAQARFQASPNAAVD